MAELVVGDLRLRYDVRGDGDLVLLLHAFTSSYEAIGSGAVGSISWPARAFASLLSTSAVTAGSDRVYDRVSTASRQHHDVLDDETVRSRAVAFLSGAAVE